MQESKDALGPSVEVGPYQIETAQPIAEAGDSTAQRMARYKCSKDGQVLTAKRVARSLIGAAAKRKSYQKWNVQVRAASEACSIDQHHTLATIEVVRTPMGYWFFQEYDADKVIPLGLYLSRLSGRLLSVGQLRLFTAQLAGVLAALSASNKFIHGNLDARAVFVDTEAADFKVRLDTTEHHQLRRLLKTQDKKPAVGSSTTEAETQEETSSDDQVNGSATKFEEFSRQKKVTVQSDIRALAQLVLLFMKFTDPSELDQVSHELSDLVKSCSFQFRDWSQVLEHAFLADPDQAATMPEQMQAAATQEEACFEDLLTLMPLKESVILPSNEEEAKTAMMAEPSFPTTEEAKQATLTRSRLCADLEKLLETGYAELICSDFDSDEPLAAPQDSPFPQGLAVFDDGTDGNEEEDSNSEEDGYLVICARDIDAVPVQQEANSSPTVIGQGAQYVMGQASKLLGSLLAAPTN